MTETSNPPEAEGGQPSNGDFGRRLQSMSAGALIGWGVAILIVGLVVGLAAGYKIEQTRVKNDVKKVKESAKAKASSGGTTSSSTSSQSSGATLRVVGTVDSATSGSVSIPVGGTTRHITISPDTVVVKANSGSASDVTPGSRVVVKTKPGSLTDASEVIVLPADAKLGTTVEAATPTSLTITSGGKKLTINTQGATVETVTAAQASDITSGAKVVAQTRESGSSTLTATEIIVLPSTSTFVS